MPGSADTVNRSGAASQVYDLILGTNPQFSPTAPRCGRRLNVFDSESLVRSGARMPGEIVETDGKGLAVSSQGGPISGGRSRLEGMPRRGAARRADAGDLL